MNTKQRKQGPKSKAVARYWTEFYGDDHTGLGLCTLCGNSGFVDTKKTAISPTGINVGRLNFCICPNGQWLRKDSMKKVKGEA